MVYRKGGWTRIGGLDDKFTVNANLTLSARWISIVGYFKIRNAEGKYLTYAGASYDPIVVESADDSATQIWKIEPSSEDDKYHIRPAKYGTLAMNVFRGGNYPCTIQHTADNIDDTIFAIISTKNSSYIINWKNYKNNYNDYYLAEGNDTVGETGKIYWVDDLPQEWIIEATNYSATVSNVSSEYSRIRYGSGEESGFENVLFDKGYDYNLSNLKMRQKDNSNGIHLDFDEKSVEYVLKNDGCVLFSYAMVLYALGATVTKYDYRTNKIEEIVADPYSCLMANIGADVDWSEAQSGEITIREQYFIITLHTVL